MHESSTGRHGDPSPVRWRVTTTTGLRFACRVNVVGARVEVRLTTDGDGLVCAREVSSLDAADTVAHGWLRALVARGEVDEPSAGSCTATVH